MLWIKELRALTDRSRQSSHHRPVNTLPERGAAKGVLLQYAPTSQKSTSENVLSISSQLRSKQTRLRSRYADGGNSPGQGSSSLIDF